MQARLTARSLGFAGLLPFYLFLAGFWWLEDYLRSVSIQGFVIYSLAILCFLAGALWGMARHRPPGDQPALLIVSNGLVVFAVAAVLTAQALLASILLMLSFLALLWFERSLGERTGWYAAMRAQLTAGVVVAHLGFIAGQLAGA